jgi:hypothetical protein
MTGYMLFTPLHNQDLNCYFCSQTRKWEKQLARKSQIQNWLQMEGLWENSWQGACESIVNYAVY